MGIPFLCLAPLGGGPFISVSRGSSILTFHLSPGDARKHISSWTHPSSRHTEDASLPQNPETGTEWDQPQAKKRKLDSDADAQDQVDTVLDDADAVAADPAANEAGQKREKVKANHRQVQDQPFVILMASTKDGSHLVAVTGHDKTVWVLEHDGKGGLKEISNRHDNFPFSRNTLPKTLTRTSGQCQRGRVPSS
jgi:tRNA (guanine-N(7)-)-methyltransferase subunit TRM82